MLVCRNPHCLVFENRPPRELLRSVLWMETLKAARGLTVPALPLQEASRAPGSSVRGSSEVW